MIYSHEVEHMCVVKKGPNHGPAPIPEEGKWVKSKEIKDISGLTHGIGWCAPQQGACVQVVKSIGNILCSDILVNIRIKYHTNNVRLFLVDSEGRAFSFTLYHSNLIVTIKRSTNDIVSTLDR